MICSLLLCAVSMVCWSADSIEATAAKVNRSGGVLAIHIDVNFASMSSQQQLTFLSIVWKNLIDHGANLTALQVLEKGSSDKVQFTYTPSAGIQTSP